MILLEAGVVSDSSGDGTGREEQHVKVKVVVKHMSRRAGFMTQSDSRR